MYSTIILTRSLPLFAASLAALPFQVEASAWGFSPPEFSVDNKLSVETNDVELADLDADGFVDVIFAHGSNAAQKNAIWMNMGGSGFEPHSVFGSEDRTRVIKIRDIDSDGDLDIIVGNGASTASYVMVSQGRGQYLRKDILEGSAFSLSDLDVGDVDGDGNLDIIGLERTFNQSTVHLWLGDGAGSFQSGKSLLPVDFSVSRGKSVILVDHDNDRDLDVIIIGGENNFPGSEGESSLLILRNDGPAGLSSYALEVASADISTHMGLAHADINCDDAMDLILAGVDVDFMSDPPAPTETRWRGTVLLNDQSGQFDANPGNFWQDVSNPFGRDRHAATLDFDNDGSPDLVVAGEQIAGMNSGTTSRILNNASCAGLSATQASAFPLDDSLVHIRDFALADFDGDERVDVAIAQPYGSLKNFVLLGQAGMVAKDSQAPHIKALAPEDVPDSLMFGQRFAVRTRVHDFKTPAHWHDFDFDPKLQNGEYNLVSGALFAHGRRLPYVEFALDLQNPEDLAALADTDPSKLIAPGVLYGESLWRFEFDVPFKGNKQDTLTWRLCAIDAAENKACIGPFQSEVTVNPQDCGDGQIQAWETCDTQMDALCVQCEFVCGDAMCSALETEDNCPQDCEMSSSSTTSSDVPTTGGDFPTTEGDSPSTGDVSSSGGTCAGDNCGTASTTGAAGSDTPIDGCGCQSNSSGTRTLGVLGLAGLLLVRRRSRRDVQG